jgi:protein-tyrosine kinase
MVDKSDGGSIVDKIYKAPRLSPLNAGSYPNEDSDEINYPILYRSTRIHRVEKDWLEQSRVLHSGTVKNAVSQYKLLRTRVLRKLRKNGWNSIGVLSAKSSHGASITAVNLAISISMEYRHTVLLVDFNLINPCIHQYFNYSPDVGVSDCILHGVDIKDALFTPNIESLVVLPGREEMLDSSERLSSPTVRNMVNDLKSKYPTRIVIFDLPPMLEADDALAFIDQFDAGLLVIKDGGTTKKDLKLVSDMISDKPLLGTVFNDSTV